MLTVKNTSPKIIGFGIEHILPGEVKTLPEVYSETHPTIKFYLDRGWLTKASENGVLVPPEAKLEEGLGNLDVNNNPQADEGEEEQGGEEGQGNPSKRNLDRMKIEELKALALERKLQVPDNCTKDAIVKIIIASFQASGQQ